MVDVANSRIEGQTNSLRPLPKSMKCYQHLTKDARRMTNFLFWLFSPLQFSPARQLFSKRRGDAVRSGGAAHHPAEDQHWVLAHEGEPHAPPSCAPWACTRRKARWPGSGPLGNFCRVKTFALQFLMSSHSTLRVSELSGKYSERSAEKCAKVCQLPTNPGEQANVQD